MSSSGTSAGTWYLVAIKLGDLAQGLQNIVSKFKDKSMNNLPNIPFPLLK
jgi:hypothetical protein